MESSEENEFRPVLMSRRGEWTAWGLSAAVLVVWVAQTIFKQPVLGSFIWLGFFFLLSALAISLGNWVDRRTAIRVHPDRIGFENGLRKVDLAWDQIVEVETLSSSWGERVRVYGLQGRRFDFRMLKELRLGSDVKDRTGFVQGEQILKLILDRAGLGRRQRSDGTYYYARL
jgi:hypothetical protein